MRFLITAVLGALLFESIGCGNPKLSRVGESCTKSDECEGTGRCVANVCVSDKDTPSEKTQTTEASTSSGKLDGSSAESVAVAQPEPTPPKAPEPKVDPCAGAKAVEGAWTWSSTVVGAKRPGAIGVNGHYDMTVT